MATQYEPGTYALIDAPPDLYAVRALRGQDVWLSERKVEQPGLATAKDLWHDNEVNNVRPLVVLDYTTEEAAQVAHLVEKIDRSTRLPYDDHDRLQLIATAIRSATRPLKPPEPTGLGAVVKDHQGALWVKWCLQHRAERCWKNATENGLYLNYPAIDAVEVLSDGVSP